MGALARIGLYLSLAMAVSSCAYWQGQAPVSPKPTEEPGLPQDYSFVLQKLSGRGATPEFLAELAKSADLTTREKVIRLNVFGYKIKPDYSPLIGDEAVRNCVSFIQAHRPALKAARQRYGVSREAIAALLWVETRHGTATGVRPTVTVFLNLAMADHPQIVAHSLEELKKDTPPTDPEYATMEAKIRRRSTDKAAWAVDQLMALQAMQKRQVDVFNLKGSYAGAFGIPQFIPTTYLNLAVSSHERAPANLYDPGDAIFSVANFLHLNGWREKSRKSEHRALKSYNASDDYVNAILELARKVSRAERKPRRSAG